ncbi:hypothetical protein D4R52_01640 [bacterium]|nr:MAG: hypothetical protein D4R52_01640 [bacterium]
MDLDPEKHLLAVAARAAREIEIEQARAASPGMELGAAFKKWKDARAEPAEMLLSSELTPDKKAIKALTDRLLNRPCSRDCCAGTQRLEAVCSGCIEGRAGYKSKWTCSTCMHRDLAKESINEWLIKLSSP